MCTSDRFSPGRAATQALWLMWVLDWCFPWPLGLLSIVPEQESGPGSTAVSFELNKRGVGTLLV